MGIPEGAESQSWRYKRKCKNLSPSQADTIFFPKPGGKSNAAKKYCETCPVINRCLDEALALGLVGMWAGTTEGERRRMADFVGSLACVMPPEPTAKTRKLRRILSDPNVLDDPLFGLEGPSDIEVLELETNRHLYGL